MSTLASRAAESNPRGASRAEPRPIANQVDARRLGLYPQMLGPDWNDVDEAVQRVHPGAGPVQAHGRLRVRHGDGRIARSMIGLLGLPSAGEAVPTRLLISPCPQGETWLRVFGERRLATTQRLAGRGVLIERLGPVELRFRLSVVRGALVYEQTGAALRLLGIALPLPRWFAPQVAAREQPYAGSSRTVVSVAVVVAWAGPLISYEGIIAKDETS